MGTYQTTSLPGASADRLRLGINTVGQSAFLTRLLPQGDPLVRELPGGLRAGTPSDSPRLATLVEIGAADGWVYAVEKATPALPLGAVLAAARAANAPLSPAHCAWFAARVSEAAASLGEAGHLRLSLQNVLVRLTGEPYVLGASWARLLPRREGEAAPEWFVPGRERHADACAAAELARQLSTLGAPAGPDDWGALPVSLKSVFVRAATGKLSSAAFAAEIDSALQTWGREADEVGVAAWLQRLGLPAPAPVGPESPRLVLEPVDAFAPEAEWSEPRAAMGIDGRLERPVQLEQPIQLEPLASGAARPASPHLAPLAAAEKLELDERSLAHAFGVTEQESSAVAQEKRARRGRWLKRALLSLLLVAGAAGAWSQRASFDRWMDALSKAPAEKPRGAYGAAVLQIDSVPEGAEVRLGDEVLGQTPYVGHNDLPPGEYRLRLLLTGYRETTAAFQGGEDVRLELKLRRR